MSTKTTFKRVALVAVAALGLGVMSVAPSSAAVINLTTSAVNGTATTATSDSTTAGTVRVTFTGQGNTDSVTVTSYVSSKPLGSAAAAAAKIVVHLADTSTSTVQPVVKEGTTALRSDASTSVVLGDSSTVIVGGTGTGLNSANFRYYLSDVVLSAGTYVITSVVTPYSAGSAGTPVTRDVSIVVSAVAADSVVASSTYSTAFLSLGASSHDTGQTVDSAVAVVSTASAADIAEIKVILKNAAQTGSRVVESVTATITGPGLIGTGGAYGKSILVAYNADPELNLGIRSDGTAGTATISISTPSVTFAPKTVTFYAATASTAVASVAKPVIEASSSATEDVINVAIKDANGATWAGSAYIYASSAADALIAGSATPAACAFDATDGRHECDVTGRTAGTAKFKIIDATTVAAATWTSNEVSVRSAVATPASVKLVFDKATYQPGEKAVLSVVPMDAAGAQMPGKTYANLLATGGITPNISFSTGSDTLTATEIVVSASSSSASGTTAGQKNYTVYVPFASGDITVTATGGTSLPAAGRVAVTATASVVNSSVDSATDAANEATDAANAATDAALASADAADAATAAAQDASDAVAALSTRVSSLIKDLRKQIRELTKLVQRLL